MLVNGLPLPADLEADVQRGGLKLDKKADKRLRAVLKHTRFGPDPYFLGAENIEGENSIWTSGDPYVDAFLGRRSIFRPPGDINPRKVVNIGILGTDAAISLDYRTAPPRVVYLTEPLGQWRIAARSYTDLKSKLGVR
jgi:hypothetical protein